MEIAWLNARMHQLHKGIITGDECLAALVGSACW